MFSLFHALSVNSLVVGSLASCEGVIGSMMGAESRGTIGCKCGNRAVFCSRIFHAICAPKACVSVVAQFSQEVLVGVFLR